MHRSAPPCSRRPLLLLLLLFLPTTAAARAPRPATSAPPAAVLAAFHVSRPVALYRPSAATPTATQALSQAQQQQQLGNAREALQLSQAVGAACTTHSGLLTVL
ncbi:hypothetical protein BST61_g5302 [Cercospora zeina]